MLTLEDLATRRALIAESADLTALRDRLIARARPVLERMPSAPDVKAFLSRDGGVCPDDGFPLEFDPWSPDAHRCPHCGQVCTGERHHAHWARTQHLWIAERAAHLAALHGVTGEPEYAARARDLLALYYDRYFALRNWDNVLGPSHLFFSTYLESIWILNYLAAAFLLRETGQLADDDLARIDAIADEAATIIAEFNEGLSNRQTWNSAALTAIATWFGDEQLAVHAIEGRTGLLGHLGTGFGDDGLWYEGENYHLFALRGLLIGFHWARAAGSDSLDDPAVVEHLGRAIMAASASALPDLTFPARKDSRFGVSLTHPAYTETGEAGLGLLGDRAPSDLGPWLATLYQTESQSEQTYDAYLHDAGEADPLRPARVELSWWALLVMPPALPGGGTPWQGSSQFMPQQGLAILRDEAQYASLECGGGGGGHGHPDRLHLTLFADGVHWLPDPGTGSYVTRDLFWYRSTLAHNAPRLDGQDQSGIDQTYCSAFAQSGSWGWMRGAWGDLRRTVVQGPEWHVDLVTFAAIASHEVEVAWHLAGIHELRSDGSWDGAALASQFVTDATRLVGSTTTPVIMATHGVKSLACWFAGTGDLLRATGPGLPTIGGTRPFFVRRGRGTQVTFLTVLDRSATVTAVALDGTRITVRHGEQATTIQITEQEAVVTTPAARIVLAGALPAPAASAKVPVERPPRARGTARWIDTAPALDGSLAGFDRRAPLQLDDEHQYFRSELPFPGPDSFAARAWVNWHEDQIFVAVEVNKEPLVLRPLDAAPLRLDNEPDDINPDGVQIYINVPGHSHGGWLLCPLPDGTLAIRAIDGEHEASPRGAWGLVDGGYRITAQFAAPGLASLRRDQTLGFDIMVNEMRPDRQRRAGQLVWSGGPGWVYLRGDRHEGRDLGQLELTG